MVQPQQEKGGLGQRGQTPGRVVLVEVAVAGGVVQIGRPNVYRRRRIGGGKGGKQILQPAVQRLGVQHELQQIIPGPVEQLLPAAEKAAGQPAVGQGPQKLPIGPQVLQTHLVQHHHHVDIAVRFAFTPASAALDAQKDHTAGKSIQKPVGKQLQPGVQLKFHGIFLLLSDCSV